jgi:hypothetical protein
MVPANRRAGRKWLKKQENFRNLNYKEKNVNDSKDVF